MDSKTFEQVYETFAPKVLSYLQKRVDSAHVEDIYQEVWIKVSRSEALYDPQFTRAQWVFTIAHSCLIDYVRKVLNRKEVQLDSDRDLEFQSKDNPGDRKSVV